MRQAHLARFSLAISILAALGGCGGGGDDPRSGPASCPDCLVMPIEVLGAAGTTRETPFALSADPGSARKLHLQVHGLAYQDMASVQVNEGPWVPLSNDTVTVAEPGLRHGGIGGSFATLKLSLDLAAGAVRTGGNTLRFRFEKTDGRTLGFRVLAFDVLDDAGGSLLSGATKFVQDDPSTWKPPRSAPEDIAAGEALWKDAELSHSPLNDTKLRARCADCHAHDGRDLKYFNYSNLSIVERSKFHGLTEEQGEQIASYIRALPGPAPGRPWNPPYQPGPGLDDKPIEEWSAGAGLEWALDADRETQAHLPGEGESRDALVGPGARLASVNVRQTPIALQLLDWNHWLPDTHPKDALGEEGHASLHNVKLYGDIRAALAAAKDPDARMDLVRGELRDRLYDWANSMTYSYDDPSYPGGKRVGLYDAIMPEVGVTAEQFRAAYAGAAWNAVKQWEIMQEFALEGEGPALYGMNGESRSWLANRHVFDVSPHIMHQLRSGEGMMKKYQSHGDCSPELMNAYLANAWYHLQMILNSGNRQAERGGHHTIDWGYQNGLMGDLERASGRTEPMRLALFTLRSMEQHDSGFGPEDSWFGWNLRNNVAGGLHLGSDWSEQPEPRALVQTVYQVWLEKNGSFTEEQWKTELGISVDGSNVPPADWVLGQGTPEQIDRSVADDIAEQLLLLRDTFDVDGAILSGLADFGAMMWPNNDWNTYKRPLANAAPAPGGVTIEPGVERAKVSWSSVPGATSYNVKRATSPAGAFLPVAYFVSGTSFTDHGLDGGRTYHYKVSANVGKEETAASEAATAEVTRGLVAHYTFDGASGSDVADEAGINGARLFGGASRGEGKSSNGLVLGKGAYLGTTLPLSRWLGKSGTLSAWVKTTGKSDETYHRRPGIAGVAGGGQDECYWGVLDAEGRIGLGIGGGDDAHIWSQSPINDGAWHHVTLTRDADTGAAAIYVDGALSASATLATGVLRRRFFSIGRTDVTHNDFPGALDDVRIYDYPLSAAEASALAQGK